MGWLESIKKKVATNGLMNRLKALCKEWKLDKCISRIDRYIIVKFLGTYFFAIALIISIAVVFDFNEWIDNFINNKAPMKAIFLIII